VAREGCTIFLGAIREKREAVDDYSTEVGFTAVHELGHAFNLCHVDTPSFMAQSNPSGPFGSDALKFIE
jgi:predicted Zn-dependent protease